MLSEASRKEHEAIAAELAALVAAAPVRQVLDLWKVGLRYALFLECGHIKDYFAARATLRCHACRREAERG